MSYRKQVKKQRRLEREHLEHVATRNRALRRGALLAVAALGLAAIAAFVVAVGPFSGGASSDRPVQSTVLTMRDDYFDPKALTIAAGVTYKIEIVNTGQHPHNVWLVGPNRKDYRSDAYSGGESGSMKLKIDQPGEYGFVCTFHAQMGGKLVVE